MTHERDERWAYVVLVLLVAAYIVYRLSDTSGLPEVSLRLPRVDLGGLARGVPYALAPLFAVLSEIWRRRRAKAIQRQWEERARAEGFVRSEENVKVRFVKGARGSMQSDVRLTRAALYLFDRAGRRDPMRFAFRQGSDEGLRAADAALMPAVSSRENAVRVIVSGAAEFEFEFASANAEAWWADIRHAVGKSADRDAAERRGEQGEDAPGYGDE